MSVASVVANLFDGRLPFRVEAFDGSEVAPTIVSPANEITLRILRPEALIRILRRPAELGLARAFVAGDLELDGDLDALFSLELPSLRYLFSPATFLPLLRLIGPAAVRPLAPPAIEARRSHDRFELDVTVDLTPAPDLASAGLWRLGLAAVIEGANGARSYWALAHPPGAPDFHAARGFAYALAMANPS